MLWVFLLSNICKFFLGHKSYWCGEGVFESRVFSWSIENFVDLSSAGGVRVDITGYQDICLLLFSYSYLFVPFGRMREQYPCLISAPGSRTKSVNGAHYK